MAVTEKTKDQMMVGASRLRNECFKKGITQKELEELTGYSQSSISGALIGENCSKACQESIALEVGMDPDSLYTVTPRVVFEMMKFKAKSCNLFTILTYMIGMCASTYMYATTLKVSYGFLILAFASSSLLNVRNIWSDRGANEKDTRDFRILNIVCVLLFSVFTVIGM